MSQLLARPEADLFYGAQEYVLKTDATSELLTLGTLTQFLARIDANAMLEVPSSLKYYYAPPRALSVICIPAVKD